MPHPSPLALLGCCLLASLCAACMPHADQEQCLQTCAYTLDSIHSDLRQQANAPAPDSPLDTTACIQACRSQLVPVEYHCLIRSFDSHQVQSCFERPRSNAHLFDRALRSDPQIQAEYKARNQRIFNN